MYGRPATIGQPQMVSMAGELQVGESYPFFVEEENQFCIVLKIKDTQLSRVRGQKPLFTSAHYLEEFDRIAFTVSDSADLVDEIVVSIENTPQLKEVLLKTVPNGIEFYFVNSDATDYSIKPLFLESLAKTVLKRQIERM